MCVPQLLRTRFEKKNTLTYNSSTIYKSKILDSQHKDLCCSLTTYKLCSQIDRRKQFITKENIKSQI